KAGHERPAASSVVIFGRARVRRADSTLGVGRANAAEYVERAPVEDPWRPPSRVDVGRRDSHVDLQAGFERRGAWTVRGQLRTTTCIPDISHVCGEFRESLIRHL